MKRLLLTLALLLGGFAVAGAQSSVQGGGLSTKAIQALEECFDSADNFTCAPPSGTSMVVVGEGLSREIPQLRQLQG